jgi:hypothetical protein
VEWLKWQSKIFFIFQRSKGQVPRAAPGLWGLSFEGFCEAGVVGTWAGVEQQSLVPLTDGRVGS